MFGNSVADAVMAHPHSWPRVACSTAPVLILGKHRGVNGFAGTHAPQVTACTRTDLCLSVIAAHLSVTTFTKGYITHGLKTTKVLSIIHRPVYTVAYL